MRKITLVLFVLGLIFEIIGFPMSHADDCSWILIIASPTYGSAKVGYDTVRKDKILRPANRGFNQMFAIVKGLIEEKDPSFVLNEFAVDRFTYEAGSRISIGNNVLGDASKIVARFSNGQTLSIPLKTLEEEIELLKSNAILYWSVGLFVGGLVLQIVGFVTQYYSDKDGNKAMRKLNKEVAKVAV